MFTTTTSKQQPNGNSFWHSLILITAVILSFGTSAEEKSNPIEGSWVSIEKPEIKIRFTNNCFITLVTAVPPRHAVLPIKFSDNGFMLGGYKEPRTIKASITEDQLEINWPDDKQRYRRLKELPETLIIAPFEPPKDKKVAKHIKMQLRQDFAERLKKEQAIRLEFMRATKGQLNAAALELPGVKEIHTRMNNIDNDNQAFLLEQVKAYGWLDVKRFGPQVTNAAFMIALHSGNLRLMRTVVKSLSKSKGKGGKNENAFAAMSDRVALMMQRPMQYGIQGTADQKGRMIIPILSDRKIVNANRKRIGQPSIENTIKKNTKRGQNINFMELDAEGMMQK